MFLSFSSYFRPLCFSIFVSEFLPFTLAFPFSSCFYFSLCILYLFNISVYILYSVFFCIAYFTFFAFSFSRTNTPFSSLFLCISCLLSFLSSLHLSYCMLFLYPVVFSFLLSHICLCIRFSLFLL